MNLLMLLPPIAENRGKLDLAVWEDSAGAPTSEILEPNEFNSVRLSRPILLANELAKNASKGMLP